MQNVKAFKRRMITITCRGLKMRLTMPVIDLVTTAQNDVSCSWMSSWVGSNRLLNDLPLNDGADISVESYSSC